MYSPFACCNAILFDIDNTEVARVDAAGVDITGALTVSGDFTPTNLDIEGYAAIGNGSALSAENGLIIDYDKSSALEKHQLQVNGLLTLTGTSTIADMSSVRIKPEGITTADAANTVTMVSSLSVKEPVIIKGDASTITKAATVNIEDAPTEGASNYALWCNGAVGGATISGGTF